MIPIISGDFDIQSDTMLVFGFHLTWEGNQLDKVDIFEPAFVASCIYTGVKRMQSDGLNGVTANGVPVSAQVILIQEHQGIHIEVHRTNSSDGSWSANGLPDVNTLAIAIKADFNAGITADIAPEG